MGRSSAGKSQESSQLGANTARQNTDNQNMDQGMQTYNKSVDNLEAQPGYSSGDLQGMQAEQAGEIHSIYGNAGEQIARHNAATGQANDAGYGAQVQNLAQQRGFQSAMGQNSIAGRQADAALATRRMIPSFRQFGPQMYANQSTALGNQNANMIGGRMSADNSPTFLQSAALAGIGATGQAFQGKA